MSVVFLEDFKSSIQARRPRQLSAHWLSILSFASAPALFLLSGLAASLLMGGGWSADLDQHLRVLAPATALYAMILFLARPFAPGHISDVRYVLTRLALALFATFASLVFAATAAKEAQSFSRIWFFSWLLIAGFSSLASFAISTRLIRRAVLSGRPLASAVSLGFDCAPLNEDEIRDLTNGNVHAIARLRIDDPAALRDLTPAIGMAMIDYVYLRAPWNMTPDLLASIDALRSVSARVLVVPDDAKLANNAIDVQKFGNGLAIVAVDRPLDGWSLCLKRMQDICLGALFLAMASPVMAIVALAIKADSRGPVFFRQRRRGFNGRTFELWKFRSMFVEQADPLATKQTRRGDPRVTRVGRFIRRTSLDELPQFFNVLTGDMSIVGPRPHALNTRTNGRELSEILDEYASRHRMKPGMTGLAQINGYRGELDDVEKLRKRVEYDLAYIEQWSSWMDLKIILKTLLLVVRDPFAY